MFFLEGCLRDGGRGEGGGVLCFICRAFQQVTFGRRAKGGIYGVSPPHGWGRCDGRLKIGHTLVFPSVIVFT